MTNNQSLFGNKKNTTGNDIILVYSKMIKESLINSDRITKNIDKQRLKEVIKSLLQLGKSTTIENLELNENCKEWINSLLSNFPNINEQDIKYLLNDFTSSMQTRMREEEKYVLSILSSEGILLCHTIFGEQTVTPHWEVIERMMDRDNVIRFVYFKKDNDSIKVIYYELYPSDSFVKWLGLQEKEAAYYLGGKNRIYTEIDGIRCALELTDDEIEEKLLKQNTLRINDNQISLLNPLEKLQITQIRVGKNRYNNIDDFLQDFMAKRYDLSYYQDEYKKLKSSLKPLFNRIIDEKHQVITIKKNGVTETLIKKRNPNFDILFCDKDIELRETYFNEILIKLLSNQPIRIFHAGTEFFHKPIKIKSMEIFNKLHCSETTKSIIEYYHKVSLNDKAFDKIILCAIFDLLKQENQGEAITYLFSKIIEVIGKEINISKKFVQKEGELIEFKSRSFFEGSDTEIVNRLTSDISNKLTNSDVKIYIIGADEVTHNLEPLPSTRFKSDRLSSIEERLKNNLNVSKLHFTQIPLGNAENCILLLTVGV
jgi:hypothetical protein